MSDTQHNFLPVSFVVPAHNEEQYLQPTLQAILDSAQSILGEFEIIVVNDASTDGTSDVVEKVIKDNPNHASVIRLISVELRNIGAVRNAGASEAIHPWLFFIDADTRLPARTLQQALEGLASGWVGGGAWVALSDEKPIPLIKWLLARAMVFGWQFVGRWAAGCFMFCKKTDFDDFGGFDEKYFAAEELFFSRNLKRRGKFRIVKGSVITSARKLHGYSTWSLIKFLTVPFLSKDGLLRSRKGLDVLYQDKR